MVHPAQQSVFNPQDSKKLAHSKRGCEAWTELCGNTNRAAELDALDSHLQTISPLNVPGISKPAFAAATPRHEVTLHAGAR